MMQLNKKQEEAVLIEKGPLLILAGAGSGKTRTLTKRIAYKIKNKAVKASSILAITFTNKAAAEMKERLYEAIGDEASYIYIGTFHSICTRILRRYAGRINFSKDFVIYDSQDQNTLLKNCLRDLEMDERFFPVKAVKAEISSAKNSILRLGDYAKVLSSDYHEVFLLYEKRLREYNALDFDNIILYTIDLLEKNPDILESLEKRFNEVLVDEYQDTNLCQYHLVHLLTRKKGNIVVVGDVDQSIYGWRGADIRNILEFEKDYQGAKKIILEQNYRSTKYILESANHLIEYNKNRPKKNLWTDCKRGEKVRIYEASSDRDEAEFVVGAIKKDKENLIDYKDIAILYRMHSISRIFEEKLRNEAIPYKIIGGVKFYERKEIKDALAYIKLLVNKRDEISLIRALTNPKRGIGNVSIERMKNYAEENNNSLYEELYNIVKTKKIKGRALSSLNVFLNLIDKHTQLLKESKASDVVKSLLGESGLLDDYKNRDKIEKETRADNIQELINDIVVFENNNSTGLEGYIEQISLIQESDSIEDDNSVTLMSLHSSKGLEFKSVYLVALEDGIFPSQRAKDEDKDIEEERRLAYVGITRAMEKLVITHSRKRMRFGSLGYMEASKFLDELPESALYYEGNSKYNAYSVSMKIEKPVEDQKEYKVAQRVIHPIFGKGKVISFNRDDRFIQIIFDEKGIKKLHIDYANLKKI